MRTFKKLQVKTNQREELIDITERVKSLVQESKIREGTCKIFVPHTTAGITINENADPSVKKDIIQHLRELIPKDANFSHMEGNSDAHIKSSLIGASLEVLIHDGSLVLGTWQGIMFAEFDGSRNRNVHVQLHGES